MKRKATKAKKREGTRGEGSPSARAGLAKDPLVGPEEFSQDRETKISLAGKGQREQRDRMHNRAEVRTFYDRMNECQAMYGSNE